MALTVGRLHESASRAYETIAHMPLFTFRLAEHLDTLTRDQLLSARSQLPGFDAPDRYIKKADLAAAVEAALLDARRLKLICDALDAPTRQAIRTAVEDPITPGILDVRGYWATHGAVPMRFATRPGRTAYSDVSTAMPLALFFDEEFRLPVDLADALRTLLGGRAEPTSRRKLTVPTFRELSKVETYRNSAGETREHALTQVETEAHAFHDVLATLRMIEAGKLKINANTLTPAQTALKTLNGALSLHEYAGTVGAASLRAGDAVRTFGLISIVIGAGWAKPDDDGRLLLTATGSTFLQQPSAIAMRAGFGEWLHSNRFDEVTRIGALRGAPNAMAYYGTPPSSRRAAVVQTLASMPGECWIDVETFFRMVLATGNDFEVETDLQSHLWIGAYGTWNNLPIGRTDSEVYWRVVKCQLMLALLFEPLACFGAVDVAYLPPRSGLFYRGLRASSALGDVLSQYDVLRYIRLTVLGQYLLGVSDDYTAPMKSDGPALRVLPNQQIVVASRLAGMKAGHPVLSKFCDQVSDDVYQLAPAKLIRTIEKHDMSVTDVITYLERESGVVLPRTVRSALDDVARRSALISEVGGAVLFQVRDAHLALELEHDSVLKRSGCRRSGDWIVVPADKVAAFRRRTRELGYAVQSAA